MLSLYENINQNPEPETHIESLKKPKEPFKEPLKRTSTRAQKSLCYYKTWNPKSGTLALSRKVIEATDPATKPKILDQKRFKATYSTAEKHDRDFQLGSDELFIHLGFEVTTERNESGM